MIWEGAVFLESPNRSSREGEPVVCVVIHHISLPPGEFGTGEVHRFFTNRLDWASHPFFCEIEGVEVSAHFFIERDGATTQFVDTDEAAWHAGVSVWRGREQVNRFSVGVELEGDETSGYTDAQYETLDKLLRALREAYPGLEADGIVGHDEIAPGRKTDPGPLFDYARARAALVEQKG